MAINRNVVRPKQVMPQVQQPRGGRPFPPANTSGPPRPIDRFTIDPPRQPGGGMAQARPGPVMGGGPAPMGVSPTPQMQQTPMPQGGMGLQPQVAQEQLNSNSPGQGGLQGLQQANAAARAMGLGAPMGGGPPSQTPYGMPQQVGGAAARAMGLGAPMGGGPFTGGGPAPMGGGPAPMGAFPRAPAPMGGAPNPMTMKKGGRVKAYAKGGTVFSSSKASSAASRGDGIAQRGKTKGRMC